MADTVTAAVASNFRGAAEELAQRFHQESGHVLRISSGSTGKLHAQIVHGAPYDVFLAADAASPARLEAEGFGATGSRFTYALGQLVLWTREGELPGCADLLVNADRGRIAIANPDTAPYGRAAKDYLQQKGLWETVAPAIVYGENVAQALHFAVTGNARYAIVGKSLAVDERLPASACWCTLPDATVIEQQALLLTRAARRPVAIAFLEFLKSAPARETIRKLGYGVP